MFAQGSGTTDGGRRTEKWVLRLILKLSGETKKGNNDLAVEVSRSNQISPLA